ncbi:MAG: heat-inducible transcriptional repressor [Candidatus Tokpelaia sp. JSC189]|nr:MAG: heat-inducible transcriptional repressor [Candidatus Tokpelaia sp. JSC189]
MKSSPLNYTLELMNERSCEIFRRIVESYLHDGDPVGSRNLSRSLSQSLSPATIRNVMSDLERLGLIYAPHISAGRMPTQSGLRFFIDAFMEISDLSPEERKSIEMQVHAAGSSQTVEQFLIEASQILSALSHGAGLVLTIKAEGLLKHIEFVQLDFRRALVVLVTQNGDVENRIIELPSGVTQIQLTEASNYLNTHIQGYNLNDARLEITHMRDQIRMELNELSRQLVEAGLAAWDSTNNDQPVRLIVHGRANLLKDIHAEQDLKRLRNLFNDLETRDSMIQLLDLVETGHGVRIFIGSENKLFSLSGSSLVVSPYRDAEQRVIGALGVIGPTRLNYARIVPMVDYTAQLISQLLR